MGGWGYHVFNNTNVYANKNGVIIGISKSTVGSVGDITLLKERPMPFGRWEEAMHDPDLPEAERCHVFVDRGYRGIEKHLPGTTPEIPHKKSKKAPLTPEQREHNHRIHSERVLVEHTIGRLKRYARLSDPYDGNRGAVQPGVQRDHRTGEPGPLVGLCAKGPAATGPVEDAGRLGQSLLPGACQVGFSGHIKVLQDCARHLGFCNKLICHALGMMNI